MSYLKNIKKAKRSLVEQANDAKNGSQEKDLRFLNYYDLKDGEQMKVLLVPDVNGELFCRYSKHGPNLKYTDAQGKTKYVRGVGSIGVMKDSSKSPIMQHGYDLLNKAEETGVKAYKEEAKKFFPKNYAVVSVVVLESPIEITQSDDGNDLKLFDVPYSIEKLILNMVTSGEIEEEDLWVTPLIIKKSKGDSGWSTYEDSLFSRKPISADVEDYLEDLKIDQYEYETIDIIPETPTADQQQEWLEKAIAGLKKATSGKVDDSEEEEKPRRKSRLEDDEEEDQPRKTRRAVVDEEEEDEVPVRKSKRVVEEAEEDDLPDWADGEEEEAPAKRKAPIEEDEQEEDSKPSVSDRLSRLRGRR